MIVYVVCENSDAWGGTPIDMRDAIIGVFLSRGAAEECLWTHARYRDSSLAKKLTLRAGKAQDEYGVCYFELLDMELNRCETP